MKRGTKENGGRHDVRVVENLSDQSLDRTIMCLFITKLSSNVFIQNYVR